MALSFLMFLRGALLGVDFARFQGSEYILKSARGERVPFADAEADCVRLGGHLASINTRFENEILLDFITQKSSNTEIWVGGRFTIVGNTKVLSWLDNSTTDRLVPPFEVGEPDVNDPDDLCLMFLVCCPAVRTHPRCLVLANRVHF
jgi:hypothetical protein